MPSTVHREDVCELKRSGDVYKQHLAVLDDLVSQVLPNVNTLGLLLSANDFVSPLNAGCVISEHLCVVHLREAKSLKEVAEI